MIFSVHILETYRLNCGTLSYQYKEAVLFVFVINVKWFQEYVWLGDDVCVCTRVCLGFFNNCMQP